MPSSGSLISLADELNGLIELLEKLFGLGAKGMARLHRHKAGKAAESLDTLHFAPRGFREPLENIAAGLESPADFETLASFSEQTSAPVVRSVDALRDYVAVVRRQCGAAASSKLEELIDGLGGKFVIRYEIEGLSLMGEGGHSTSSDRAAQAEKILQMIEDFNSRLIQLHDMILPPRGAPK